MIKLQNVKAHSKLTIKCLQFDGPNGIVQLPLALGLKRIANGDIFKLDKVIWANQFKLDGSPAWTWAFCCIKQYSQHLKGINDSVIVKDAGGTWIASADIVQV